MKLALYKGKKRLFNRVASFLTKGPYSHVEILFSDGMCGSSSDIDGGVRLKVINLEDGNWDVIDLPGDEEKARRWFENHTGEKYDYIGLTRFVWSKSRGIYGRWLCSEAVMEALGYRDSWSFCPNSVASFFKGPNFNVLVK